MQPPSLLKHVEESKGKRGRRATNNPPPEAETECSPESKARAKILRAQKEDTKITRAVVEGHQAKVDMLLSILSVKDVLTDERKEDQQKRLMSLAEEIM